MLKRLYKNDVSLGVGARVACTQPRSGGEARSSFAGRRLGETRKNVGVYSLSQVPLPKSEWGLFGRERLSLEEREALVLIDLI